MSAAPKLAQPELSTELSTLQQQANVIEVRDADSYELAASFLRGVKTFTSKVAEVFDPIVAAAHRAHKEATTQRGRFLAPAADAERTVKTKMSAWFTAEQNRKAEAARAEQERLRREEEDRRLAEAAALETQGRAAEAERLIETPVAVPIVRAEPAAPKVSGVSMREEWDFEVADESQIPRRYFVLDTAAVRRDVKSFKERAAQAIPGIRVTKRMVPAASGF